MGLTREQIDKDATHWLYKPSVRQRRSMKRDMNRWQRRQAKRLLEDAPTKKLFHGYSDLT